MKLSVQKLKQKLQSNNNLAELLDVLKGIAIARFQDLDRKKERFSKYHEAFEGFVKFIDFRSTANPYTSEKGYLGIIMITSNEGFMGGLNTRVINTALDQAGSKINTASLMVVGEQGATYLRSIGHLFKEFPGIITEERNEGALKLKDYIVQEALAGRLSRLICVYPKPVTFMVQNIDVITLLPCREIFEQEAQTNDEIIVESSLNDMIKYLVESWITQKLFEVFEASQLAEFSARAVHLEESYQTLQEKGKKIQYQYFRSVRESIDKGLRDMLAARMLVKKKNKLCPTKI